MTTSKFHSNNEDQRGLYIDGKDLTPVQDWCLVNRMNVKQTLSFLRKQKVEVISVGGVDCAFIEALENAKYQTFTQKSYKQKARSEKIKQIAQLRKSGYNFVKALIDSGVPRDNVPLAVNYLEKQVLSSRSGKTTSDIRGLSTFAAMKPLPVELDFLKGIYYGAPVEVLLEQLSALEKVLATTEVQNKLKASGNEEYVNNVKASLIKTIERLTASEEVKLAVVRGRSMSPVVKKMLDGLSVDPE